MPRTKATTKAKKKTKPYVPADSDVEYPYNMFPWKLIHKEGDEKRSCYFECEEHRTKYIKRYSLTKRDIIFSGYKFDNDR